MLTLPVNEEEGHRPYRSQSENLVRFTAFRVLARGIDFLYNEPRSLLRLRHIGDEAGAAPDRRLRPRGVRGMVRRRAYCRSRVPAALTDRARREIDAAS